jgi:hypothetical protein
MFIDIGVDLGTLVEMLLFFLNIHLHCCICWLTFDIGNYQRFVVHGFSGTNLTAFLVFSGVGIASSKLIDLVVHMSAAK